MDVSDLVKKRDKLMEDINGLTNKIETRIKGTLLDETLKVEISFLKELKRECEEILRKLE